MPTVYEIEQAIFRMAPKELAAGWDNVGHLLGRRGKQVEKVLVALDITAGVAAEAAQGRCDLIVSHHPVIFPAKAPLLAIRDDEAQGRIWMELIRNDIAAICMHTNLDAAQGGVNDALAAALGLEDVEPLGDEEGVGRMGSLPEGIPKEAFFSLVAGSLRPNGLRWAGGGGTIRRVAVGGGACGDFFPIAAAKGCDAMVTSDVKYSQFLDAAAMGLCLVDAGHFPTEDVICPVLAEYLREQFPDVAVVKSDSHREIIQYFVNL